MDRLRPDPLDKLPATFWQLPKPRLTNEEAQRPQVSFMSLPLICEAIYNELRERDPNIVNLLTKEMLQYYGTVLLWTRILHLKRAHYRLTDNETRVLDSVENLRPTTPNPLTEYLAAFGTREALAAPHLPEHVIEGIGGFPLIDDSVESILRANLFPGLGAAAEAITNGFTDNDSYVSRTIPPLMRVFKPCGTHATTTMPNQLRRTLSRLGMSQHYFQSTFGNTAYSRPLTRYISDVLQGITVNPPVLILPLNFNQLPEESSAAASHSVEICTTPGVITNDYHLCNHSAQPDNTTPTPTPTHPCAVRHSHSIEKTDVFVTIEADHSTYSPQSRTAVFALRPIITNNAWYHLALPHSHFHPPAFLHHQRRRSVNVQTLEHHDSVFPNIVTHPLHDLIEQWVSAAIQEPAPWPDLTHFEDSGSSENDSD